MGWETRGNNQYYYQKTRIGKRVLSRYIPDNVHASLLQMSIDTSVRCHAARAQMRCDAQIERRTYSELFAEAEQIGGFLLLCEGYHQHKYQWRKRRNMARRTAKTLDLLPPRPAPGDTSKDAFLALMKRCRSPMADAEDVTALRALAPHYPRLAEIGDLLNRAVEKLFTDFYKDREAAFQRVAYEAYIVQRRAELGYETASALERPLINALILAEQRMAISELIYSNATEGSSSLMQFVEQRLDNTHRRYLRLVETLARIRRVRIETFASDGQRLAGIAVERSGS